MLNKHIIKSYLLRFMEKKKIPFIGVGCKINTIKKMTKFTVIIRCLK